MYPPFATEADLWIEGGPLVNVHQAGEWRSELLILIFAVLVFLIRYLVRIVEQVGVPDAVPAVVAFAVF
ncbi:MAG: hypothetical protein RJB38_589 [Pseudomonadota bacterium]